jgi:hypothetical protein
VCRSSAGHVEGTLYQRIHSCRGIMLVVIFNFLVPCTTAAAAAAAGERYYSSAEFDCCWTASAVGDSGGDSGGDGDSGDGGGDGVVVMIVKLVDACIQVTRPPRDIDLRCFLDGFFTTGCATCRPRAQYRSVRPYCAPLGNTRSPNHRQNLLRLRNPSCSRKIRGHSMAFAIRFGCHVYHHPCSTIL